MRDEYINNQPIKEGDIIVKHPHSRFCALVTKIDDKIIYCQSIENAHIPSFSFIWNGDYVKLSNLTGETISS